VGSSHAYFVDEELSSFVRVDVVYGRRHTDHDLVFGDGYDQMVTRIADELARELLVNRVVEDIIRNSFEDCDVSRPKKSYHDRRCTHRQCTAFNGLDLPATAPPFFIVRYHQRGVAQFVQIAQGANLPSVAALVLTWWPDAGGQSTCYAP
jgi:hypothetical protein